MVFGSGVQESSACGIQESVSLVRPDLDNDLTIPLRNHAEETRSCDSDYNHIHVLIDPYLINVKRTISALMYH
jgi:hypothetical protein